MPEQELMEGKAFVRAVGAVALLDVSESTIVSLPFSSSTTGAAGLPFAALLLGELGSPDDMEEMSSGLMGVGGE